VWCRSAIRPELIELETLTRPNRELVEDTFRVMSITFSYLEGPKTIDAFVKRRTPPGRLPRPYSYLLYARLGDLYMEKERYTDAAVVTRLRSQDRNNEKAPLLEMQAIEAYRRADSRSSCCREEGVRGDYSFGTAYWQGRDPRKEPQVVAVLKTNLKDVAQYYHAQAQRSKSVADYQEAAKWYHSYLTSFPMTRIRPSPTTCSPTPCTRAAISRRRQGIRKHRLSLRQPREGRGGGIMPPHCLRQARRDAERRREGGGAQPELDSSLKFAQAFPAHRRAQRC